MQLATPADASPLLWTSRTMKPTTTIRTKRTRELMVWTTTLRMTAPTMTSMTTGRVSSGAHRRPGTSRVAPPEFAAGSCARARPDTMPTCRLRVHWDTERGGRQLHAIALAAACEINLFKQKKMTGCIVRMIKKINAASGKAEEVKLHKLFYSEDEWSRQALLTVNSVRATLTALIKTFLPFCGVHNKEQV
eukprot:2641013-Rhodomonas_salina.1